MTMPIPAAPVPAVAPRLLERLEAEIVELATQLTAASARLVGLIGEFDAAEGWREWGMRSTAHWLSWHAGMSLTTGREHVRVARVLTGLPRIAASFAAGRLSYSKVRALTRFATAESEVTLVEMGENATAAQIERLRRGACRAGTPEELRARQRDRKLSLRVDDDGSVVGTFRLPPEDAAVFLHGLRAEQGALGPRPESDDEPDTSAETSTDSPAEQADRQERRSAADALVSMAEKSLRCAEAEVSGSAAERFQLVLHTTLETLAQPDDAVDDGSGLCELDDGTRLHPATARRLTCGCPAFTATIGPDGRVLHLGRRTRRIKGRLLRAVHVRDRGRCRAPGCTARAEVIHHLRHWANGGSTCLGNLISLCAAHHWAVHEGGCALVPRGPGVWSMLTPAGTLAPTPPPAPAVPPLPHDPDLKPGAVTGGWDGAALDLNAVLDGITPRAENASAEASASPRRERQQPTRQFSTEAINRYFANLDAMEQRLSKCPPIVLTEDDY